MFHKLAARMTVAVSTTKEFLTKRRDNADDTGMGTIEMVILILGLMAVAAIVVAAIVAFVNGKVSQIA